MGGSLERPDPYTVLGAKRGDDSKTVRRLYRRLSLRHHPDKSGSGDSTKFREVSEAFELLSDPGRRRRYDTDVRTSDSPHSSDGEDVEAAVLEMKTLIYYSLIVMVFLAAAGSGALLAAGKKELADRIRTFAIVHGISAPVAVLCDRLLSRALLAIDSIGDEGQGGGLVKTQVFGAIAGATALGFVKLFGNALRTIILRFGRPLYGSICLVMFCVKPDEREVVSEVS